MKKSILIIVAVFVVLGAVLIGSGIMRSDSNQRTAVDSSNSQDKPTQTTNMVMIEKYAFSPNALKVKKGTTVTWTNSDQAKHNVELDAGQPDGGPTESPLMGQGESYSFTFNTVGTFNYHCSPHPYMKASVEVTE